MLALTQAFKTLQPFKQVAQPVNIAKALQSSSFSTTATTFAEQPQSTRPQVGASSLFDNVKVENVAQAEDKQVADKQYHWSSANFKASPQKLNMIARQIRNLPVDEAMRQLQHSPKRSAKKILHNLAFAKKNAQEQKDMKQLVVAQAWVGKGRFITRANYHGRGQFGMMQHKEAHMKFILKEANTTTTTNGQKSDRRNVRGWKESKKVWTPLVENKPIYNAKPFYNW